MENLIRTGWRKIDTNGGFKRGELILFVGGRNGKSRHPASAVLLPEGQQLSTPTKEDYVHPAN